MRVALTHSAFAERRLGLLGYAAVEKLPRPEHDAQGESPLSEVWEPALVFLDNGLTRLATFGDEIGRASCRERV